MRLDLSNIDKCYRSGWLMRSKHAVLKSICLSLDSGQRLGVVGESGAGKSTLGMILAGLLRPDRGRVLINGSDIWRASKKNRVSMTQKVQVLFQHPEDTFDPRWTIQQSLMEPFVLNGKRPSHDALTTMLTDLDVDPSVLPRRSGQLSGGELQRIAMARIFAISPWFIILDEPTAMLDVLTEQRIIHLLKRFQERTSVGYLLISHDARLVKRFCDAVYFLENGLLLQKQKRA